MRIQGEGSGDGFSRIHRDHTIDCAAASAIPAGEGGAGVDGGGQGHLCAITIPFAAIGVANNACRDACLVYFSTSGRYTYKPQPRIGSVR